MKDCIHYVVRWEPVLGEKFYRLCCIDCGKWIEKKESRNPPTLNNMYRMGRYSQSVDRSKK
jgi:hypothetical protein